MGMFTVYCDDSGSDKKSRVAAVSGFISNVGQWELFNQGWTQILKAFGVDQMHRADLESFKGEFLESRGWGPRRRTAILKKLHSIMKRRAKVAIGSSVIRKEVLIRLTQLVTISCRWSARAEAPALYLGVS